MKTFEHVLAGLHSEIPVCCVLEFALRDALGWWPRMRSRRPWCVLRPSRFTRWLMYRYSPRYRPCLWCRVLLSLGLRRPAVIHNCSPKDPRCDHWTRGKKYVFYVGEWVAVATPTARSCD